MMCSLGFSSWNCVSNNNDIVGVWEEYRADGDDYGLSSWKFNNDGSGIFSVQGYTNKQQVAFTWEKTSSRIRVDMNNGDITYLSIDNGLLIESNSYSTIVFKKR